jgi:uncharacterized membrane protein SpoIIM required for sporulation
MDLTTFIHQRRPEWRRLEEILQQVEGSGLASLDDEQAVEFGQLYRRTASDLNQAQTFVTGDATVQYLNDLVARCYFVIYARTQMDLRAVLRYFAFGFPAAFRRNMGFFLLATALFLGGTAFGFLVSYSDTDKVGRSFLLPDMQTIKPGEGTHEQSTGQLAEFSTFLYTHNVTVTLFVFVLGVTCGVGTAWLLFWNGVTTGALMAVFIEANAGMEFATGILPHGVLEIPAALIGGAAGFVLAHGILRARPWSRLDELTRCGKEAIQLVFGCFLLLAFAGILEAGVARAPEEVFGTFFKLSVAGVFATLFLAYVLLLGWGQRSSEGRA